MTSIAWTSVWMLCLPLLAAGGILVQLEDQRLDDPGVGPGDAFGADVAVDGDTALVGASADQASGSAETGAAYVFRQAGTAWSSEALLVAPDGMLDDAFGWAVALDADTAAVGAPSDDTTAGSDAGSVYVFTRSGSAWSFQAQLFASDAAAGDEFGGALDLRGDQLVVGAELDDDAGDASGSVYVFTRTGTSWSQAAKLTASDATPSDRFGASASLDGTTLAVGAPGISSQRGATYVFEGAGGAWTQQAKLVASDGVAGDHFGRAVVDGGTLVAGALDASAFAGAVYVFERSGTAWTEQLKLLAPDGQVGDRLSSALALEDGLLVAGAQGHDAVQTSAGACYLWRQESGGWVFDRKLLGSDLVSVNLFGAAVGLSGGTIVAGGPGPVGGSLPGSAYAFTVEQNAPSFCDSNDGALASCPCGNAGLPDTGCDVQQGTGGVGLEVQVQNTAPLNRATLGSFGYPAMFNPSVILIRAPGLDAAGPVVFGDGLRCVALPVVRLEATFANQGTATHTFGHGSMAGTGTFFYQAWFRNTPTMFCTPAAFNLSNGRQLTW